MNATSPLCRPTSFYPRGRRDFQFFSDRKLLCCQAKPNFLVCSREHLGYRLEGQVAPTHQAWHTTHRRVLGQAPSSADKIGVICAVTTFIFDDLNDACRFCLLPMTPFTTTSANDRNSRPLSATRDGGKPRPYFRILRSGTIKSVKGAPRAHQTS